MNILWLLLPYLGEQISYYWYIVRPKVQNQARTPRFYAGYEWYLYGWDVVHFVGLVVACVQLYGGTAPFLVCVGGSLFVAGVGVRIISLRQLGRNYFGGIGVWQDHQVVSTGIYQWLRHPLHIGTNLQILGLSIFVFRWQPWLAGLMVLISGVITFYRNWAEDQFLLTHLHSYQTYYVRAWDMIDWFWKK